MFNGKQKNAIIICAVVAAMMEMFPPWVYEFPELSRKYPAGYHFLLRPPLLDSGEKIEQVFNIANVPNDQQYRFRTTIDYRRLLAQDLVLLLICLGIVITLIDSPLFGVKLIGGCIVLMAPVVWVSIMG